MSLSGFFDRVSNVSVGPVSAETVERTRQSGGACADGKPAINSFVLPDNQQFDCTYVEWVQRYRAVLITTRMQRMMDGFNTAVGTEVATELVPWDAVVETAKGLLSESTGFDFLKSLCAEMQNRSNDPALKAAWLAKRQAVR